MVAPFPHPEAQAVLDAIASSTTTDASVSTLTRLLWPDVMSKAVSKNAKENTSSTKNTSKRDIVGTAPGNRTRTRKADASARPTSRPEPAPVADSDDNLTSCHPLGNREKYSLAMLAFNTSLKALSDALKEPTRSTNTQLDKGAVQRGKEKKASGRAAPRRTPASGVSGSAVDSSHKTDHNEQEPRNQHILSIATCAHLALKYMREEGKGLPENQLEQGYGALIAKLLSLGLADSATLELRAFKTLLERRCPRGAAETIKAGSGGRSLSRASTTVHKQSRASLLDLRLSSSSDDVRNLAVTYQLHVLKLLSISARSEDVEEALPFLLPSSSVSPINLLVALAKDEEREAKAARSLEILAGALVSICPQGVTGSKHPKASVGAGCSPEAVLQLQQLALEARIRSWKIAKHQLKPESEFWEPLSRCVRGYSRQVGDFQNSHYRVVLGCYESAKMLLSTYLGFENDFDCSLSALETLGLAAEMAGNLKEAIRWMLRLDNQLRHGKDQRARSIRCRVKLAALKVGSGELDQVANYVSTAVSCLNKLSGITSTDLDVLLGEVMNLRKTAVRWVVEHSKSVQLLSNSSIFLACCEAIAGCAKFVCHLISGGRQDKDSKVLCGQLQEFALQGRVLSSTIDALAVCARGSSSDCCITWSLLHAALCDSLTAAEQLDTSSQHGEADDTHKLAISQVYWIWYVQQRKLLDGDVKGVDILHSLERSVDILRGAEPETKIAEGFAMKLERLAAELSAAGKHDCTESILAESVRWLIEGGVLEQIAERARTMPLLRAWEAAESGLLLAKVLRRLHKSKVKSGRNGTNDLRCLLDNRADEQQAALLEWCLVSSAYTLYGDPEELGKQLLDTYSGGKHPLRRTRVASHLLTLSATRPDTICDDFREALKELTDDVAGLDKDAGLAPYSTHYRACYSISKAFCCTTPSIDLIQNAINVWIGDKSREVDDFNSWVSILRSVIDYLKVSGHSQLRITALTVYIGTSQRSAAKSGAWSEPVQLLCELAQQYIETDAVGSAAKPLQQATCTVTEAGEKTIASETLLLLHVSLAWYHEVSGDSDLCQQDLRCAQNIIESNKDLQSSLSARRSSDQCRKSKTIADALSLVSKLCLRLGKTEEALTYAKLAVKIYQRLWVNAERTESTRTDASGSSDASRVYHERNAQKSTSKSKALNKTQPQVPGAVWWSQVGPLFEAQLQLAGVFAHMGVWQEAIYYGEQAESTARAVHSKAMLARSGMLLMQWWVRSGRPDKTQERSDELSTYLKSLEDCHVSSAIRLEQGRLFKCEGEMELAIEHFDDALRLITNQASPNQVNQLSTEMQNLRIEETQPKTHARPVKKPKSRSNASKRTMAKDEVRSTSIDSNANAPDQHIVATSLRNEILRSKTDALQALNKLKAAASAFNNVVVSATGSREDRVKTCLTHHALAWASLKRDLETDFAMNSLLESTLALTVVEGNDRAKSTSRSKDLSGCTTPRAKTSKSRKTPAKGREQKATGSSTGEKLQQILHQVLDLSDMALRAGSKSSVERICHAVAETTFLLSISSPLVDMMHPLHTTTYLGFPNSHGLAREYEVIRADRALAGGSELVQMPTLNRQDCRGLSAFSAVEQSCIDLLPLGWSTISLALNENQDELYITRYDTARTPFILRLPMTRHRSREEDDEDSFTFRDGKLELREIIELSDQSTKGGKNMSVKGAKTQWWSEREDLDARLRDLLINIENIWFGGFKSILSQRISDPLLLSELHNRLQRMLAQHLPSRRGRSRSNESTLDTRILELFVGLGDPSGLSAEEEFNLSNDLMDLLHFLIDHLQFNGELNSYDEIDFDAMVVECIDALRSYHQAVEEHTGSPPAHTILVLDRNMHAFPWESMPFLQNNSVSRLPSLSSLHERLVLLQEEQATVSQSHSENFGCRGYRISLDSGASVLNPSGDLSGTQALLSPYVKQLPASWDRYSGPEDGAKLNEDTWSHMLRGSSVLLYFGHGSTSQYIRARGVRKLAPAAQRVDQTVGGQTPRCATTLLMGCSSAATTENGEFLPHGMVLSYLTAGAPAVVGCLWDVTDRDCDRFTVECGSRWGLWARNGDDENADGLKKKMKKGGPHAYGEVELARDAMGSRPVTTGRKGSSQHDEASIRNTDSSDSSLSEKRQDLTSAVVASRAACYLRYLNAAAMVVYGIPVYVG